MRIEITGLEEVRKKAERVSQINKPVMTALEELMREAEVIANRAYMMNTAGNSDFTSEVRQIPNGYELQMFGEDIGFLEFGAGVRTSADEFASEVGFPVAPGSWSETHSRVFSEKGYWFYAGVRYTGLAPTRGMQKALDHIRNNIVDRIEKAIRKWLD